MTTQHHTGDRGVAPVDVREGTSVRPVNADVGRREARAQFGGIDIPATLVGTLAALAVVMLLGGVLAAAIGTVGYQAGLDTGTAEELGVAGLAGGLVTLFLAFLVGGWAAARMARYDGVRNGAMTAVWTIVLSLLFAGIGAALGSEYDVFNNVDLPRWLLRDDVTAAGLASAAVGVLAMFLGAMLGGMLGARYHRRADATIIGARDGGIASSRTVRSGGIDESRETELRDSGAPAVESTAAHHRHERS